MATSLKVSEELEEFDNAAQVIAEGAVKEVNQFGSAIVLDVDLCNVAANVIWKATGDKQKIYNDLLLSFMRENSLLVGKDFDAEIESQCEHAAHSYLNKRG